MKVSEALAALRQLQRHPGLREQIAALGSHFLLNLSLFAIVIVSSFILEPAEFAHLSLANNYIVIGAMLMDFGLNTAALKLAIEGDRRDFLDINLALKAGFFVVFTFLFAVFALFVGPVREFAILSCAAGLTFWYATRCIEQYRRLFWRYAALNLKLAASRIIVGGLSLATKDWMIVALAVHVVALVPICAATIIKLLRRPDIVRTSFQRSTVMVLMRLAPAYFLAAALYSAIPILAQTAIYLGSNIEATGAFGIVVLLVGPISLLTNTLRIYLQPQIILKSLYNVDVFGLGQGSLHVVVGVYLTFLLLGVVPASFVIDWFYQERLPQAGMFLLIYGSACCVVDALGFYNMRYLRGGLIWVALVVNVVRAALAALPLLRPEIGAYVIVVWSAGVLVAGEFMLFLLLNIVDRTSATMSVVTSQHTHDNPN